MKVELSEGNRTFESINTGDWSCIIPEGKEEDFVSSYSIVDINGNYKWLPVNIDGITMTCESYLNPAYTE